MARLGSRARAAKDGGRRFEEWDGNVGQEFADRGRGLLALGDGGGRRGRGGAGGIGGGFERCGGERVESKDDLLGGRRGRFGLVGNVCGEQHDGPMAPGLAARGQQERAGDASERDGEFEGARAGVDEPDGPRMDGDVDFFPDGRGGGYGREGEERWVVVVVLRGLLSLWDGIVGVLAVVGPFGGTGSESVAEGFEGGGLCARPLAARVGETGGTVASEGKGEQRLEGLTGQLWQRDGRWKMRGEDVEEWRIRSHHGHDHTVTETVAQLGTTITIRQWRGTELVIPHRFLSYFEHVDSCVVPIESGRGDHGNATQHPRKVSHPTLHCHLP